VNEDLRRSFSEQAREWVKNFTLESAVAELEKIYSRTLSRDAVEA
jgi:hypothetical protein